ncbi:hypothetical protein [Azospirillum soli]|uniref:hypothetical protein n=1 Tax=Azospirillum soli TaxID=1304799 RepID=UPI001AEA4D12|nr:hypothetical protein [Azospirillum soli]MBP2316738.1 hypothetical protein [Azospirillum soli]
MARQDTRMEKRAAEQLLGGDPGKVAVKTALKVAVGGAVLIALLFGLGVALKWGAVAIIGIIVGFLWGIGMIASLWVVLFGLANRRSFKRAVAAVQAGDITVSWFFYSSGIVVVDEVGRKLFVNGAIHDFAAVKAIEWTTLGHPAQVRIVLRSGANPVLAIPLGSSDDASLVGHRLHNVLGNGAGEAAQPVTAAHGEVATVLHR